VKRQPRILLVLLVLVGLMPVGVGLAAVARRAPADTTTCGSPYLESPVDAVPHTADYFVNQNVIRAGETAHIHLAAYSVVGAGAPSLVGQAHILDWHYQGVKQGNATGEGGTWTVADSCGHRTAAETHQTQKSDAYYFESTWTAPTHTDGPTSFELAVSFSFQDSTTALAYIEDYLINVTVVPDGQPMPQMASYLHMDDNLEDAHGAMLPQNTVNFAYDLQTLPAQVHMHSVYNTQGNPAPYDGQTKIANGMLSTIGDTPAVFRNTDESSGVGGRGGGGGGVDRRITIPCLLCGAPPFNTFGYDQISVAQNGSTMTTRQDGGTVGVAATARHIGTPGQDYYYQTDLGEPLTVCDADPCSRPPDQPSATFALKVGRYIIDNGIYGPIGPYPAGASPGNASNFGDGQGLAFYADAGTPAIDPTHAKCGGRPGDRGVCVYWQPVPPTVIGRYTTMHYDLTLTDRDRRDPHLPPPDPINMDRGSVPYAVVDPPGNKWSADVQVRYEFTDDSGAKLADPLFSTPKEQTFDTGTGAPPPTDTATATTAPPPPTDTPTATAVPPTDTPTPEPTATTGPAAGTLSSVATPYAWIAGRLDPAATAEAVLPTTRRGGSPDRDTAHFAWPAGVALRVLPALSEHPDEARLYVRDPNGSAALAYPDTVDSITYTVTGGPCGTGTLAGSGGGTYAHDGDAYPGEVAPASGATTLPGASRIAWVVDPAQVGRASDGVMVCSVDDYLRHTPDRTLPPRFSLDYTVTQRLHFTLVFRDDAQGTGADAVCALAPIAPQAAATPGPAFAGGAPVPMDGAALKACDAGNVRLLAVRKALAAGGIVHDGSLDSMIVYGTPVVRPNGDGTTTLEVAFQVTRSLALGYHLIMLHEVAPAP